MATINFTDKVALNDNPNVQDINKVKDSDMNLIKQVVNQIIKTLGLYTDNWISSGTYSIGDIVINDNRYFKNITGTNTTTEPKNDTTNWEETTIILNEQSSSLINTYCCDYINDCNTYSTSETFTGKYWIDNKPIYRKVIYMASPSNYEDIQTGVVSSNIIWYDAIISTGGGYINKINSTEWDDNYRITGDIDPSGKFRLRAGASQTQITNLNVIIEYTKSN